MHGKGILTLENDYVYEGDFKFGLRHGEGILKCDNSDYFYNGQWNNGNKNGFGNIKDNLFIIFQEKKIILMELTLKEISLKERKMGLVK